MLNAAAKLDDLNVPPGNRLEALKGVPLTASRRLASGEIWAVGEAGEVLWRQP